jgi:hypothetical protein
MNLLAARAPKCIGIWRLLKNSRNFPTKEDVSGGGLAENGACPAMIEK